MSAERKAEIVKDRVAIVSGAARGIGRAIALALVDAGADVVLVDRLADELEGVAGEVRSRGRRALAVVTDVRDVAALRRCVDATMAEYGRLDALVNNAGFGIVKPTFEQTEDEWDDVVDACMKSTFFFSQAAARVMVAAGHGVIVNVASICGIGGWPKRIPYAAAKAGIISLTQGLGAEWALDGVRVVGVAPGHILTQRLLEIEADGAIDLDNMRRRVPRGRLGEIDDIVDTVVFLLSDQARHVNGVVLPVDGGYSTYGAPEPIAFERLEASRRAEAGA